ncbi:uncharacterized protein LOC124188517 isoform X2 [Daphnia pulex]|uniref:uncharacterized protein LOC124188517 isoform X2 n=1 Tax=Daphnia pulex TaxID=6669 RepID=UPI001EE0DFCB|nr:uncharacterized protein LOC124188517 isoform X2 [Daphnia pulex]
MAEDAQRRVESALSNFVDEIEKSKLRKMQNSPLTTGLRSNSLIKGGASSYSTPNDRKENRIALVDLSSSVDIGQIVEEDINERMAHFYVYATKLQSLASSGRSMGLASGFLDMKAFMHWSVVVKFESPESVYTLDADTSGGLTGAEFVVKVKREYPEQVQRQIFVGSVIISPRELIRRAKEVRLNEGKYDFIFANCQSWAHTFCREISPDFANNLPATIGDCTSLAATVGATVVSLGFTGMAIGWTVYKTLQYRKSKRESQDKEEYEDEN